MRLIRTLFVLIFFSSCYSQERTITFINQSEVRIDSMRIGVFSADVFTAKHINIGISEKVVTVIPRNKPKSNKHDITVDITIYPKNHKLVYGYYYTDLGGYLSNDYIIIFNDKKEIQWQ